MMALLRRIFHGCDHEFEKHTDNEPTIKTKTKFGMIYPYKIKLSYLFCKKCGKIKRFN